jgi:hypothetical protein
MDTALAVLPWILPPLLGAIIGYVTNRIAIKMLFRPLTPKRFLGLRVPLTPGVVPRNRFDLARTIARMVSEQLLSPKAVREQLDSPQFRDNLKGWIGERRRALMQRPISLPGTNGGRPHSNPPPVGEETLGSYANEGRPAFPEELAEELLSAFLKSPQCAHMVQSLAEQVTSDVGGKRISDITSSEQLAGFVHGNVLPALKNEELGNTASGFVNNWLRDQFNQNRRLKEYLTPENLEAVQGLIRNNLPTATWLIFNWLRQPDMSEKLAQIGRDWVEDTVRQQGMMTRAILSISGKKDEAIRDMPNIIARLVDDAEEALRTPEMQTLIAEAVGVTLERISGRRIKWLVGHNEQTIYWMADRATRGAFTALAETSEASVREAAGKFYDTNSQTTLGEMAERALGLRTAAVSGLTANLMLGYLTDPETPGSIRKLVSESTLRPRSGQGFEGWKFEGWQDVQDNGEPVTLESLVPISNETADRLDEYLAEQTIGFLSEQMPELSRILDVETLVSNRINSFDVKDVEDLVMSISGRHLRWINWFGAGLGAIIGLIQLAVNPPL